MCQTHALAENHTPEALPPLPPKQEKAYRFWEIEHFYRCPIIGMCLTAAEQRQLLKKCGYDLKGKSPYDIHELLVAGAESENRLSRKIERLLQRKYAHRISAMRFARRRALEAMADRLSERRLLRPILGRGQPAGFVHRCPQADLRHDPHGHACQCRAGGPCRLSFEWVAK